MQRIVVLLFISSLMFCCGQTRESSHKAEKLMAFAEGKKLKLDDKQALLFFTLSGCSGCISRTIDFCKENLKNGRIQFIVSDKNLKTIRNTFTRSEMQSSNLSIDDSLTAYTTGVYEGVFPMIVYISPDHLEITKEIHLDGTNLETQLDSLQAIILN